MEHPQPPKPPAPPPQDPGASAGRSTLWPMLGASRPSVLSTVGWLILLRLVIRVGFQGAVLAGVFNEPGSHLPPAAVAFIAIRTLAAIVCEGLTAIGLLRGFAWGRILFSVYYPASFAIHARLEGLQGADVISVGIFGLVAALLWTRQVTYYFSKAEAARKASAAVAPPGNNAAR